MLGKKKFLWTNLWFALALLSLYFQLSAWWAGICNAALPDNWGTAFFYYMILGMWGSFISMKLCLRFWKWNNARYELQYELEVNNFIYRYVGMIDSKLTRHKDFKELRDLLHMAINISKGEQKCSV
jgi:hypothetical protein